jgi:uncharacterized protein (DUF697 family)
MGQPEGEQILDVTIEAVRDRFHTLNVPLAYFDGPAGTQVPDSVLEAVSGYLLAANANAGGKFLTSMVTDDVIAAARRAHPDWPVVVAQTSLHEGYPQGTAHALPYPFADGALAPELPGPLLQALTYQRTLFRALPGRGSVSFVPIDFTHAGDGFEPSDYGHEALIAALIEAAPLTVATALAALPHTSDARRKSDAHILGYAVAAGAGDALPLAGVVLVPAVQGAMLHKLAKLHGVQWQKRDYAEFAGALGAGTLIRTASTFGIRQLVKLIPVYGQTAGAAAAAAASFAATYALGKAANFFLARRRQGVTNAEVSRVYREALRDAFRQAKERDIGGTETGAKAS